MAFLHSSPLPACARASSTWALLLALTACGSADGGSQGGETTVETWSDYCIATFTEDYAALDVFGDPTFTAGIGEDFVISSLGTESAKLVYIAATGPAEFDVEADGGTLPFTTTCVAGSTTDYLAVFSDMTVYAEEELTTPLCELRAGTALPRDTTSGSGYATTGQGVGTSRTYEIILNAFSPSCGDAERGYVSVPETTLWNTRTWLVPITSIAGPS